MKDVLGFTPDWTPLEGAKEIADALESGAVKADIYTKTLAWYTELIEWEKRMKELAPDGNIL